MFLNLERRQTKEQLQLIFKRLDSHGKNHSNQSQSKTLHRMTNSLQVPPLFFCMTCKIKWRWYVLYHIYMYIEIINICTITQSLQCGNMVTTLCIYIAARKVCDENQFSVQRKACAHGWQSSHYHSEWWPSSSGMRFF